MEVSGGSLGRLLRLVVSPRFQSPGCRFTWSPGLSLLGLLPLSRSGCGSSAAPPVLHTLRQPGFPRTPASWGVDGGVGSGF